MGLVWAILAAAALATLGLLATRGTRGGEYVAWSRRRLLIGAVLCAASFVGACRRIGAGQASTQQQPTKLSLLARLGDIWRAMGPHASGAVRDAEGFEALGKQMEAAVQALKKQADEGQLNPDTAAALETAFRERFFHIRRTHYFMATCYKMTSTGYHMSRSRQAVEDQVKILNELSTSGKLPADAVAKARAVVAKEVAFQTKVRRLWRAAEGQGEQAEAARRALGELAAQYGAGTIAATKASTEAAQTLVGFTTKRT